MQPQKLLPNPGFEDLVLRKLNFPHAFFSGGVFAQTDTSMLYDIWARAQYTCYINVITASGYASGIHRVRIGYASQYASSDHPFGHSNYIVYGHTEKQRELPENQVFLPIGVFIPSWVERPGPGISIERTLTCAHPARCFACSGPPYREFTKGDLVKGGLAIRHVLNLRIKNGT